jgi:hypothetical protein
VSGVASEKCRGKDKQPGHHGIGKASWGAKQSESGGTPQAIGIGRSVSFGNQLSKGGTTIIKREDARQRWMDDGVDGEDG